MYNSDGVLAKVKHISGDCVDTSDYSITKEWVLTDNFADWGATFVRRPMAPTKAHVFFKQSATGPYKHPPAQRHFEGVERLGPPGAPRVVHRARGGARRRRGRELGGAGGAAEERQAKGRVGNGTGGSGSGTREQEAKRTLVLP